MADDTVFQALSNEELKAALENGFSLTGKLVTDPVRREGFSEITPEDSETSWSDYGRAITSGAIGIGTGLAALSEYATEGAIGGDARQYLDSLSEEQVRAMSPVARRALGASFIPTGDEESIFSAGVGKSLGLKTAAAVPSLIASIVPAGIATSILRGASIGVRAGVGAGVARGTAGVLNAGEVANDIFQKIDEYSDEELAAQSDVFAGYLTMMSPKDARSKYMNDVASVAPIVAGAISAALGGVEAQVARRLGGETAKGFVKGAYKGAAGEFAQESGETFTGEVLKQSFLAEAGLDDMSWTKILAQTLEGGVVGGIMGGTIGGFGNIDVKSKAAAKEPVIQQTDASPLDKTTQSALEQTTTETTQTTPPPPPPPGAASQQNTDAPPPPPPPKKAGGFDHFSGKINEYVAKNGIELDEAARADIDMRLDELLRANPATDNKKRWDAFRGLLKNISDENKPAQPTAGVTPESKPGDAQLKDAIEVLNQQVGTVPDAKGDLKAQVGLLASGQRNAVLIPLSTPEADRPRKPAKFGSVVVKEGLIYFNPGIYSEGDVRKASKAGRLNDILPYGPTSDTQAVADVAKGADPRMIQIIHNGNVVAEMVSSSATVDADSKSMMDQAPEGAQLVVRDDIEKAIQERKARDKAQKAAEAAAKKATKKAEEDATNVKLNEKGGRILTAVGEDTTKNTLTNKQIAANLKAAEKKQNEKPRTAKDKAAAAKREADNAAAQEIFKKWVPEQTSFPQTDEDNDALLARLEGILADVKERGVTILKKVQGDTVSGELAYLDEVRSLRNDFLKGKGKKSKKKVSPERIIEFLSREAEVRDGNAEAFKAARRAEGEMMSRQDQGDVDARPDLADDFNPEQALIDKQENEEETVIRDEKEVFEAGNERESIFERGRREALERNKDKIEQIRRLANDAGATEGERAAARAAIERVAKGGADAIENIAKNFVQAGTDKAGTFKVDKRPKIEGLKPKIEGKITLGKKKEAQPARFTTMPETADKTPPNKKARVTDADNVVFDTWESRQNALSPILDQSNPRVAALQSFFDKLNDLESQAYEDGNRQAADVIYELLDATQRSLDGSGIYPSAAVDAIMYAANRRMPAKYGQQLLSMVDEFNTILGEKGKEAGRNIIGQAEKFLEAYGERMPPAVKEDFENAIKEYQAGDVPLFLIRERLLSHYWNNSEVSKARLNGPFDAFSSKVEDLLLSASTESEDLLRPNLRLPDYQTGKPAVFDAFHGTGKFFSQFTKQFLGAFTNAPSAREAFFFARNPETANAYARGTSGGKPFESHLFSTLTGLSDFGKLSEPDYARSWVLDRLAMMDKVQRAEFDRMIEEFNMHNRRFMLRGEDTDLFQAIVAHLEQAEGTGPNVIMARAYMENPLVIDQKGERYRETKYYDAIMKAKREGHDGVIFLNTFDGGPQDVVYAVFENDQISNRFNPNRAAEQLFPANMPGEKAQPFNTIRELLQTNPDTLEAVRELALDDNILVTEDGAELSALAATSVNDLFNRTMPDQQIQNPIMRELLPFLRGALKNMIGDTKVLVLSKADMEAFTKRSNVGGFYHRYGTTDVIVLREDGVANREILTYLLTHEGLHAATVRGLDSNPKFFNALKAIADEVRAMRPDLQEEYGFTDQYEFVAELANGRFVDALSGIKISKGLADALGLKNWEGRTVWQTVVEAIRNLLNLPSNSFTALDALMRVTAAGMEAQKTLPDSFRALPRGSFPVFAEMNTARDAVRSLTEAARSTLPGSIKRRAALLAMSNLDYIRQLYANKFINKKGEDVLGKLIANIQRMAPFADEKRQAGEALAQRFIDFARANPQEANEFAEIANATTMLNAQLFGENKHWGGNRRDSWQARAMLPYLQRRFAALQHPEVRKLYEDMVSYYRDTQNQITRQLVDNILSEHDANLSDSDRASLTYKVMHGSLDDSDAAKINNNTIFNALKDARTLRVIEGDYFPLMRHGDYIVKTRDSIGDKMGGVEVEPGVLEFTAKTKADALKMAEAFVKRQTKGQGFTQDDGVPVVLSGPTEREVGSDSSEFKFRVTVQLDGVHMFDTQSDAEAFIRDNKSSYEKISASPLLKRDDNSFSGEMSNSALAAIAKSISARDNISKPQKEMMLTALKQAAVRQMAGNRVQKRSLPRRNFSGASTDLARNTLTYAEAATRYLGKLKYMPLVRDAFSQMQQIVNDNEYSADRQMLDQVLEHMRKRVDGNVVNQQESPAFLRDLKTMSYIDKLFSPAYSFIQLMQPTMMSLPYFSGRYGVNPSGIALAKAYRDIGFGDAISGGVLNTKNAIAQIKKTAIDSTDVLGSIYEHIGRQQDAEGLTAMLNELAERGAIDRNAGMEIAEVITEGRGKWAMGLSKIDRIGRQLPSAIEQVNRAVTGVAAYRLAISKGASHEKAMSMAFDAVMNTQGDYSASNAPEVFNHPLWSVSLQFKKYALMYYQMFGDMIYRAFKDASPEERRVARKQLAHVVGVQILAAGAMGVPGMEVVKLSLMAAAALGIGGGYDDFERDVRKAMAETFGSPKAAELLMKGIVPRFIGIDLSTRLGADSLLTFGEPKKYDETNVGAYLWNTIAGAPGSLVMDQFKAARLFADAAREGDGQKALKGAELLPMPKFLADTMKAANKAVNGSTSKTTGRETEPPIGLGTAALNAFGLRTQDQAERSAGKGAEIAASQQKRDDKAEMTKLKNQFAEAKNEGDRVRVLAKLKELNNKLPEDDRQTPAQFKAFAKKYQKDKQKGLVEGGARYRNEAERDAAKSASSIYNYAR